MSTSQPTRLLLIGIYFFSFTMIFSANAAFGESDLWPVNCELWERNYDSYSPHNPQVKCLDFAPNSFEIIYRGAKKSSKSYSPLSSGGGRVWANLYFDRTKVDPKGAEDSKSKLFGVMCGLDLKWTRSTVMSVYYHYGSEDVKWGDSILDGDVTHHQIGMSYQWNLPICHFLFNLNGGYDQYDYVYDSLVRHDPDGYQVNFYPEFGLDIPVGEMFGIKPFMAMHYHYLHHDRFSAATDPLGSISDHDYNGLNNIFGIRTNVVLGDMFMFQFRASWIHEFLKTSPTSVSYFGCTPGQFTPVRFNIDGSTARDWAWLGTGMKLSIGDHLRMFADYDLSINARQTSHLFSLCLCVGW